MGQENILFLKNQNESYALVDLYQNRSFGQKDFYNQYDNDVDKILLFKKSDGEYIIRYKDINKLKIAPLQLKNFFFGELRTCTNNNRVMYVHNNDKKLFRKCREIWNRVAELIGINNAEDFVETALDDGDEIIALDVHKALLKVIIEINL